MSFGSAWSLALAATFRNALILQARRLSKPRYFLPTAFGALYLLWFRWSNPSSRLKDLLSGLEGLGRQSEAIGSLVVAALALSAWVFGKPRPRLTFTEAEIQFFFAAPATRRQVVHARLIKGLLQSALGAVVVTLIFSRGGPLARGSIAVAAWLLFSTLELHAVGASLARAWLHERIDGLRLRAVQLGALVLVIAELRWIASDSPLLAGPSAWLVWPASTLVRPFVAQGAEQFLWALLPAMGILAAHYVWVLVAAERFEDAAVENAERLARRLDALRAGGATAVLASAKARPVPFRLSDSAIPEVAIAWKGLIAMSRSLVLRIFAIALPLCLAIVLAIFVYLPGPAMRTGVAVGVLAGTVLLMLLMVGPVFSGGGGLASNLTRLDFLRTLPLSGARVVLGEALAPALVLTGLWVIVVPAAAFLFPAAIGGFERSCLAIALATAGPPLLLLGVLLQSSVVVLLPGWTTGGPGAFAMGRAMLQQFIQFVGFPILALPAALTAWVLVTGGHRLVGWVAVPFAGVATAAVVAFEIALAVGVLGRLFEAIDPSDL